jgi:hypothetical protein
MESVPRNTESKRVALKVLVKELYNQGVLIGDIAKAVGSHHKVVRRWIEDPEAFPSNGRNLEDLEHRLLSLLDEYKRAESRILEKMLVSHRALGAPALARSLNMFVPRVRVHLENLIRRGLVRSDFFKTFRLTPEGVAEARWVMAQKSPPQRQKSKEKLPIRW